MKYRITTKALTSTMLTLIVAAAALAPVAQARPTTAQPAAATQVESATVSDAVAIHARWHNVGYDLKGQTTAFPVGFGHHRAAIKPVESVTQTAPAAISRTESTSFDWTPVMLGTAVTAMVACILLMGGGLLRSRRRLASS